MARAQGQDAGQWGPAGFPRPLTTVDVIIFTIRNEMLHVLVEWRQAGVAEVGSGLCGLPGGVVDTSRDCDLVSCALRTLREKTGVSNGYLEQLGSWGSATRDPRGWSATHAYFALMSQEAGAAPIAANAQWVPIVAGRITPRLVFDHDDILAAAIRRLRAKVEYSSLPAYLMPAEFTLPELQRVYEIVLDRPLEKSAFRTRILASELIVPIARMRRRANRPAQLYRLRDRKDPVFFARTFNRAE
ncbi:MAG: NUDIX domain-containing protein [Alphaproteobacteria bacterium]|nr:NUDIX domain-containing protein [Alphaproteobacteria bacterium]